MRFEFDSSFVRPEAAHETLLLHKLLQDHPGAPLSVFGHADPVGEDEYNKQLSGRRAAAIYGLLVRDVGIWETLYSHPADHWGVTSIQVMLRAVGHDPGPADGIIGDHTRQAVRDFQRDQGLTVDGDPGPQTRAALMLKYMDAICVDESGNPFRLDKNHFLARGQDSKGKGDYQGCGEFNPVLMFSSAENEAFKPKEKHEQRNAANEPNRRVVVLLFRPGSKVDPQRWPCPRAIDPTAACRKRFWSDANKRRTFQAERRVFEKSHDTFACRFYERLTSNSPCEKMSRGRVRVLLDDPFLGSLAKIQVEVAYADGGTEALATDQSGIVRVLADRGPYVDLVFTTSLRTHALRVFLFPEAVSTDAGVWQRLVDLGHVRDPKPPAAPPSADALAIAVSEFQASHGIVPTGKLDDKTRAAIKKSYEASIPWSKEDRQELADDKFNESASQRKDAIA
jgi:hypothetical protein